MKTTEQIIQKLREIADPGVVLKKQQKFGIVARNALGIYHKDLTMIARELPRDAELALALFETGIYEARLLCSKIFPPRHVKEELMDGWTATFENWEICDAFSMSVYARSSHAVRKAIAYTERQPEFEKRAGFVIIAGLCSADKKAGNEIFEQFFPLIIRECTDERVYVKKAVNWALRGIGKRNSDLQAQAVRVAEQIGAKESKAARWIAKDALRELHSDKVRIADYPRSVYRP
jgi:3-methyladenine DNA glycosylase AlkD